MPNYNRYPKRKSREYPKFSDYEDLTIEDIHTFQELAKQNSYEYKILGQPEVRWIKIEDTYGIEVEYVRNGANNSRTHVCNYYFLMTIYLQQ